MNELFPAQGESVTLVSNGHEILKVPNEELRKVDIIAAEMARDPHCDHCGEPFTPRKGSGGKPQRFCSIECKDAFHKNGQRSQRSPNVAAQSRLPAVEQPSTPKPAPAAAPEDDFDWMNDDSVVVPQQDAIAVHLNQSDDIVIRQRDDLHPDMQDQTVVVRQQNLIRLIDRLCDIAGIGSGGK